MHWSSEEPKRVYFLRDWIPFAIDVAVILHMMYAKKKKSLECMHYFLWLATLKRPTDSERKLIVPLCSNVAQECMFMSWSSHILQKQFVEIFLWRRKKRIFIMIFFFFRSSCSTICIPCPPSVKLTLCGLWEEIVCVQRVTVMRAKKIYIYFNDCS